MAEPEVDGVDLVTWAGEQRAVLDAHLLEAGAILLRGFGRQSANDLENFIGAISGAALPP